jgi:hypothetical protein
MVETLIAKVGRKTFQGIANRQELRRGQAATMTHTPHSTQHGDHATDNPRRVRAPRARLQMRTQRTARPDRTVMTICTSSSIRTVTVGSGFAPDLLTPRRPMLPDVLPRALAGSSLRDCATTYRRWGISPRPEDALIAGVNRRTKDTTAAPILQRGQPPQTCP